MRMKISDAARVSGCHLETVRYYERIGLLPPPARTESGYRDYAEADVERIRFITRSRDLGFSLDEIRSLLQLDQDPSLTCEQVTALAQTHLAAVYARMEDLKRVAQELERAISGCRGGDRAHCTVLSALKDAAPRRALAKAR
ncbi:MerR family transcriptional regulator [Cognatilysobacter terrigena]|uniref:MerR family transcriptional regulator n=1 Tax=Cognatilysobacter terrigena TaxID=2488749 RepID=UPI001FE62CC7|nr:helix-turn-helix domain-containing protein [Lysobacter terrigena]